MEQMVVDFRKVGYASTKQQCAFTCSTQFKPEMQ